MKTTHFLACLLALTLPAAGMAGELSAGGRRLAATCAGCHGTNGVPAPGTLPALAGQSAASLATALREFKAGTRPATVMHQIAKGYSDEQIALLAAYFSAQSR